MAFRNEKWGEITKILNLPQSVAKPDQEKTVAIKSVAAKNDQQGAIGSSNIAIGTLDCPMLAAIPAKIIA
ncbi:hypothetical protein [uncultured Cohaesibacter sp.]|uniref:hypothetical protein n=1 Tax=uncultured Cohaesibacter sp. TaxID=1002546 RepID=UPI0029C933F4|nr:hypothetical protein [uncultured Cohaesibacter sp.]